MKKIAVISGILAGAFLLSSCGPTKNDAIAYNDSLVAIEKGVTTLHNQYVDQLDGHNADSLKLTYDQLLAGTKAAAEKCSAMEAFNKKKDYADAAAAYFNEMGTLLNNEGKQLVEIIAKDSVSEEEAAKVQELATKFDADYNKSLVKVQAAQAAFAQEWKFDVSKE